LDIANALLCLGYELFKEGIIIASYLVDLVYCFLDIGVPVLEGLLNLKRIAHVDFISCNVSHNLNLVRLSLSLPLHKFLYLFGNLLDLIVLFCYSPVQVKPRV